MKNRKPYFIADPNDKIVGFFNTKTQAIKVAKDLAKKNPSNPGDYGFLVYHQYKDKDTQMWYEEEVRSYYRTKKV